jgi:hypothetical protein
MGSSEEACIEVMTRHVQRVNSIYRSIDFDMDGKPDNISFMIKRVKVHTDEALNDPTYRFPGNYGVEKFLEIFSGIIFLVILCFQFCGKAAQCLDEISRYNFVLLEFLHISMINH